MSQTKFYLTSAIPYVNASPHIGHAQEFIYADTIRRYHQLMGENVIYLCGADENALKILQAAEKAHKTPEVFTDIHNQEFIKLSDELNVQIDIWQRGSDIQHHFPASQKLWSLCESNGDIYKKTYKGLYCIGCEAFYTPDELNENGECFEHPGKKLEQISEENYFFRLSKYQTFINDLIKKDKLKIFPDFRKKEALGFISKGLEDFSISRSRERAKGWGVPVPGDPSQIMYVWFDALNIYQSGIGFNWDQNLYDKLAPQDLMIIGKGILRFHAVYWPAILRSAGLQIPRNLFIHGYMTVNGQKMSKTLGNVIDPQVIIEKFGTDPLRYYLLREIPSFSDGDFSDNRFTEVYNADLANGLGNLVARIAKVAESINNVLKPNIYTFDQLLKDEKNREYVDAFKEYRLNDAISSVWKRIKLLDKFINDTEPWKQLPEVKTKLINEIIPQLTAIAILLKPFLPNTSEKIITQFSGHSVTAQAPLFPRI